MQKHVTAYISLSPENISEILTRCPRVARKTIPSQSRMSNIIHALF